MFGGGPIEGNKAANSSHGQRKGKYWQRVRHYWDLSKGDLNFPS